MGLSVAGDDDDDASSFSIVLADVSPEMESSSSAVAVRGSKAEEQKSINRIRGDSYNR